MSRIKLPNGVLANGQLNIARDGGRAKNVGAVPISHGMKRQTTGALHPHAHGQTIDDEPMVKSFHTGRSVAVHDGMATHEGTARERGIVAHVEDGSKHLRAAAVLGRADSIAPGFDPTHIGHRIGKQSLPASKRKLSE